MLFNSLPFAVFFTIVFVLYWFVANKNLKLQNLLILVASYVFYAWWDWRFLFLLVGNTVLNYALGYYISKVSRQKEKRALIFIGSFIGIGLLVYFKYFNFFIASFITAFAHFGIRLNVHVVDLALPLGISFYTFRNLSYLFDIHKNKIAPTLNWLAYFSYVAFFPCLVSGPIDKARTLMPQLKEKRKFDYYAMADALRQILWGLFKKMVIADNIAKVVDPVYDNYNTMPGSALLICVFYYSFQIYADFSGYSDMAIGFARLLGFNITANFNYPFFAQNIAEFWRRWHISLTTWLTDYVFSPLTISFRDYGKIGSIMAIIINFTLIGIWHGANWTFVLFGFIHGCYYIPLILNGKINKKKKANDNLLPTLTEFGNMALTFTLVSVTFILFRADSISAAFTYVKRIAVRATAVYPVNCKIGTLVPLILLFLLVEWLQRGKRHTLQIDAIKNGVLRYFIYYGIVFAILSLSPSTTNQFIYLKF